MANDVNWTMTLDNILAWPVPAAPAGGALPAVPWYRRTDAVNASTVGDNYPHIRIILNNYCIIIHGNSTGVAPWQPKTWWVGLGWG